MTPDTVDFGGLYAYTAIDTYTREAQVVLVPGITSEDGRQALDVVMGYSGSCKVLQTDRGKEFKGEFEQRVGCHAQRHRVSRPYRQNEQAFVEGFHRTPRKECLGWWKYKPSESKNCRTRSKSTWTTMSMNHLTWACACNHPYYPLVAFDMGDTAA